METFVVNGTVYAVCGIAQIKLSPVVYIVNVDSAIAKGLAAQNHFVPVSEVLVSVVPHLDSLAQAHTLTIANNILYIATQTRYIDIWDLSTPSNPVHKGAYPLPPPPVEGTAQTIATVHEMFVDPNPGPDTSRTVRAYVAYTRGGLFIVDININNPLDTSYAYRQMYDSDRRYASSVFSNDPNFDWRLCHSAWPTDDREYVITTDETSPRAIVFPQTNQFRDSLLAPNLKIWKKSLLSPLSTTSLKTTYYVPNDSVRGLIKASSYDTTIVPNSIHQLHTRNGYAYIAHYTRGFRVLDISDPENPVEIGYYNIYDALTTSTYDSSKYWGRGIYGVFPDENREKICYAGGWTKGLSVFKHYHESLSDTIYSIKQVNLDGTFSVNGDTYIEAGTTVNLNDGSIFSFSNGKTWYVDGELWLNDNTFNEYSKTVCRPGGKIVIQQDAHITGLKEMIIQAGGTLVVKTNSITQLRGEGVIKIRGIMNASLSENEWARFDGDGSGSLWNGIVFDSIDLALSQQSVLRNLFIHGATVGITTDHAQPTIEFCEISDNEIGIAVFSDSPFLKNNRIERNSNVGLLGYYMSTVVEKNRFTKNTNYGVKLYHCGNLWIDNRVDSNATYGVYGEDISLPFNRYTPGGGCDTTNGNSMRRNNAGVHVAHKSAPTFECDNSVHSNTMFDFILRDTSQVTGDANYPATASMNIDVDQYSLFVWTNPVNNEPVLWKTGSQQSVMRQAVDPRYTSAVAQARLSTRNRQYTNAVGHFSSALQYVQRRWEAEECLLLWKQAFSDARLNKPSNDAMSSSTASAEAAYVSALNSIRNTNAKPAWLRTTATEFLADYRAERKQYSYAIALYEDLAALVNTEPLISRRAHLALVILKHRAMKNLNAAYAVYEDIEDLFPGTHEIISAKIDLGLPLTSDDSLFLQSFTKPNREARENAVVNDYTIDEIFPNPFNPSTTISFSMKEQDRVRLSVLDFSGREVFLLLNEERDAGRHSVTFDAGELPSGTYLCRMQVGTIVRTRSMTLLR